MASKDNTHVEPLLYLELGETLKRIRRLRRMTQEELAMKVQLSRTSITNIEKGRQKILVHTLAAIATALETPIGELFPASPDKENGLEEKLSHLAEPAQKDFVKSVLRSASTIKRKA